MFNPFFAPRRLCVKVILPLRRQGTEESVGAIHDKVLITARYGNTPCEEIPYVQSQ